MTKGKSLLTRNQPEKAFLVGINFPGSSNNLSTQDSLNELSLLAKTAGLIVVGMEMQNLKVPNPATFIGKGKVEEIKALSESLHADIVLFDEELSPRNFRELEKEFGNKIRVIDRTTLILDIFARHAQTREGKIQVELAQYEYLLPRLTRAWTHLVRQAGGGGGRTGSTGGVGLRGPGETQLEVDRRKIRDKINLLKKDLQKVHEHRQRYRMNRKRSRIPVVALVGYTNAGKSTLLNALTSAKVYVADQLFATLDPTTRRLEFKDGYAALVTDTVGFIQKLPTGLIASFRATLEEITEADLLLHVVDASHPNAINQWESVNHTLTEIGAVHIPIITVLNKLDQIADPESFYNHYPELMNSLMISALNHTGIDDLIEIMRKELFETFQKVVVSIPYQNGQLISMFHDYGQVDKVEHDVGSVKIHGKLPLHLISEFERSNIKISFIKNKTAQE
jgi:GTP-binding protein HflX